MKSQTDWKKVVRRIELLMRLKSFPVAFKMLKKKEELTQIPFIRRAGHKISLCQLITQVRNSDWTVGAEADDFLSPECPSMLGLTDIPEVYRDGTARSMTWVRSRKDGAKYEASIPRLPLDSYEAVVMAPLVYEPFDPDIVLIYANPAQMMLLINSLQFEDYEVMQFYCVGETSCADAIVRCYLSGKPSMTIPCYGERRYGHAQDEDLVMALPADMTEKALRGMEALYRRGIRYPISYAGAELDLTSTFPLTYEVLREVENIRGKDNRLLLGVTGGIASGKTTVANMLQDLGAPIIDFDLLSREVVEPERPAWNDIVSYFGEQVLQEDGTLDRKTLSNIVFQDMEKRKKLEGFTHPRIIDLFMERLNEIVKQDPRAIIQAVIPLMIESNVQYRFHKVLVKVQIERLMARDGITREEAARILEAQLPIDEKLGYVDFVINNEKSIEDTQKQVERLWEDLQKIQKEKR
jgi:dephospho-CoA kinase